MIKETIILLLVASAMAAYNVTRARKLAYACAATFASEAEINQWSCKYCSEYKLISVLLILSRPKPSITQYSTYSGSRAILLKMTQLSLLSEVLSMFKIG